MVRLGRCVLQNCGLCKETDDATSGVCVKCEAGMCRNYFHVTCAQQHGLLREIKNEPDCEQPYYALCSQHNDKLVGRAAVSSERCCSGGGKIV